MENQLALISYALEHPAIEPATAQKGKLLYLSAQVVLLSVASSGYDLRVDDEPQEFRVQLSFSAELQHHCTCGLSGLCEHKLAALWRTKEHISSSRPLAPNQGFAYTREGMMQRVLTERELKAREAKYDIDFNENIFGPHGLKSQSGESYAVTLHNFQTEGGYCSCPDFQFNKLGTCKHLIYTYSFLKANEDRFARKKYFFPFVDVFLDPLNNYKISYFYPHPLDLFTQALLDKYFRHRTVVEDEDIPDMLGFFDEAPRYRHIHIRPEVLQRVEAIFNEQALIRLEEQTDFKRRFQQAYPKVELFDYQYQGAAFATFREGALLADEMGLGKTKQAVAAALMKRELLGFKRSLVICPVSLIGQWEDEIAAFGARLSASAQGTPAQREGVYEHFDRFFLVAGYETVMRDFESINALQFDLVVLDEAQRIKDYESKTTILIKRLHRKHGMVLTGTPIESRLIDLYSIVDFLDKRLLAPLWEFSYQYCFFESHSSNNITGYQNLDQLRDRLAPILLRREKRDVLAQLPQLHEYTKPVVLHPMQYTLQGEMVEQLHDLLSKSLLTAFDQQRMLQLLYKLRMLANSSSLLDANTQYSAKIDELEHILLDKLAVQSSAQKVVVFVEWRKLAQLIAFALRRRSLHVIEISGDMPAARRAEMLRAFEEEGQHAVFVTTAAGSAGLNLQAADTVINFDVPESHAEKMQRIGRIARLGQGHKRVSVINLVGRDSFEELLFDQAPQTHGLFDRLMQGKSDESAALSETQLEALRHKTSELLQFHAARFVEKSKPNEPEPELVEFSRLAMAFFAQMYKLQTGRALPEEAKVELSNEELLIRIPIFKGKP